MKRDPIMFDRNLESFFDWFDRCDEQGMLRVELISEHPYPKRASKSSQEGWLRDFLRDSHVGFGFFTIPVACRKGPLRHDLVNIRDCGNPDLRWITLDIFLPHLLNLPGHQPQEELGQLKGFFEWARMQALYSGQTRPPFLQWYRAGYGGGEKRYGLDWAGLEGKNKERQDAWRDSLKQWRKEPWFETWYQANIEGMKKLRMGPHCWLNLDGFEPMMSFIQRSMRSPSI